MQGWIKLHRKLIDWEWYQEPKMVHLFIHLLLMANHEPGKWKGIEVQGGQVLTGLDSLNKATGISIQGLRTCLGRMEKSRELTNKSTNRFRLITLCNYSTYQIAENDINNQPTNRGKLIQLNTQYELTAKIAQNTSLVGMENLSKINKQINKQNKDVTPELLNTYREAISLINKEINKQLTSKQQATNKQLAANKNVKNDNNDNNVNNEKEIALFKDYWNSKDTLQNIRTFSKKRIDKFRLRMKEEVFAESWREVVDRVADSPFCCGQNDRGWTADVSWILDNSDNYIKVLEGKYSGKQSVSVGDTDNEIFIR